jgi:hypothetical protein
MFFIPERYENVKKPMKMTPIYTDHRVRTRKIWSFQKLLLYLIGTLF